MMKTSAATRCKERVWHRPPVQRVQSPGMADPSELLQRMYAAGFALETFDRFPKAIGVSRGDCVALLVAAPDGLQILGSPGWKIGANIGVLTQLHGQPVFQFKNETVEATPERVTRLNAFKAELREILAVRIA
jgi:hypothetical protein